MLQIKIVIFVKVKRSIIVRESEFPKAAAVADIPKLFFSSGGAKF